jgi:hypothetical protein
MAYTGVAAHHINGVTIHRFFGMSNQDKVPNPVRLDQTLLTHPKCIFLIDECSMLSAQFVDDLDKSLHTRYKQNNISSRRALLP